MNKMLVIMDVSTWLKRCREESGMTLKQLEAAIDFVCSDAYLSKIENAKYKGKKKNPMRPDISIVRALAAAFNKDVDKTLEDLGYKVKESVEIKLTDEVSLKLFNPNISPKTIKMMADVVRSIVENADPDDIPEELDYRNLAGNVYPFLKELVDEDSE